MEMAAVTMGCQQQYCQTRLKEHKTLSRKWIGPASLHTQGHTHTIVLRKKHIERQVHTFLTKISRTCLQGVGKKHSKRYTQVTV